jgi:hypothetical protein
MLYCYYSISLIIKFVSFSYNSINYKKNKKELFDFIKLNLKRRVRFSNDFKKSYKLTIEQEEILIGLILGDGYLERAKLTHNTRLCLEQTYPEKEKYLLSLFDIFKPLVTINEPRVIVRKADKRTNKIYKSIAFKTSTLFCLNKYHDLFYKYKVKIIPINIDKLLTARGLAY